MKVSGRAFDESIRHPVVVLLVLEARKVVMGLLSLGVLAGLGRAAGGCATGPSAGTGLGGLPLSRTRLLPYDESLEGETRAGSSSHGFDRAVTLVVTRWTPAFETALSEELLRIGRAGARAGLGLETPPTGSQDLLVFLDARDPAWEKLRDLAPAFGLFGMQSVGAQAPPAEGEAAHLVGALQAEDETLRHLFPYLTPFGRFFRMRLPEGQPSERVQLRGAPATVTLSF